MRSAHLHTLLALLAVTPPVAWAQPGIGSPPMRPHPFLTLWDRDGDGQLSAAEIDHAPAVLQNMDEDENGRLTLIEFRASMQRPAAKPAMRGPGSTGNSQLARAGVTEGFTLPAVKAFDADGNEFVLNSLRGQYTVLVFGCLT